MAQALILQYLIVEAFRRRLDRAPSPDQVVQVFNHGVLSDSDDNDERTRDSTPNILDTVIQSACNGQCEAPKCDSGQLAQPPNAVGAEQIACGELSSYV